MTKFTPEQIEQAIKHFKQIEKLGAYMNQDRYHALTILAAFEAAEKGRDALTEPEPDAMKIVRKIREGATFGHDLSERYCKLLDAEAAALIADYGRRVLEDYRREEQELLAAKDEYIALLEKASGEGAMFAYVHGFRVPQDEVNAGVRCREKITAIAAKHGVKLEDAK